jgi:hypothetical protein
METKEQSEAVKQKKHRKDKQLLANTTQKTKSKLEQRELY